MPPRRDRLMREAVEIRPETQAEWRAVEALTRDAFWNRYRPGCEEHYLLHEMRTHPDYLPDLSRVAVREGELLGAIAYTVSHVVETDGTRVPMATFGPLGVRPAWQGCGVGAMLGAETMELARAAGYPAIVIQGDPAYYARLGFRPASDFDILGTDGQPDVHLLAAELFPGALSGIRGRFVPSDVFQQLEPQALEAYDRSFPPRRKQVFPGQL